MDKLEEIARCDNCKKAHKIITRAPDKPQSVDFLCRCGNKITGQLDPDQKKWNFTNASSSERREDEPVFIHEPELT